MVIDVLETPNIPLFTNFAIKVNHDILSFMKTHLVRLAFFLSCFVSSKLFAQPITLPNPAFQHGEQIRFTVFYNVIGLYVNAGTATFTTSLEQYNNIPAYHVVAIGVTNKKYDWIFKVRDRYESYFDAEQFRSLRFVRNINEGDFSHQEDIVFNRTTNTAFSNKKSYKLSHDVLDVINAIYFARNIDFNSYRVGDRIPIDIFLDEELYHTYIKYMGKEVVKTKYGTFKAIKLKPMLIKGSMFEGGEKMTLWVTDDSNHIPVRAESPISVGSVKVDMMSYENLRYPLSSLLARD